LAVSTQHSIEYQFQIDVKQLGNRADFISRFNNVMNGLEKSSSALPFSFKFHAKSGEIVYNNQTYWDTVDSQVEENCFSRVRFRYYFNGPDLGGQLIWKYSFPNPYIVAAAPVYAASKYDNREELKVEINALNQGAFEWEIASKITGFTGMDISEVQDVSKFFPKFGDFCGITKKTPLIVSNVKYSFLTDDQELVIGGTQLNGGWQIEYPTLEEAMAGTTIPNVAEYSWRMKEGKHGWDLELAKNCQILLDTLAATEIALTCGPSNSTVSADVPSSGNDSSSSFTDVPLELPGSGTIQTWEPFVSLFLAITILILL